MSLTLHRIGMIIKLATWKQSERGDHFNIWDGGNRLRAAVMVGKTHVLCNIRTGLTDEMKRTCL